MQSSIDYAQVNKVPEIDGIYHSQTSKHNSYQPSGIATANEVEVFAWQKGTIVISLNFISPADFIHDFFNHQQ